MKGTRVFGASDDLIELEGDVDGEVGCYGAEETPVLLVCSDGTVLTMQYGKGKLGIWKATVLTSGALFCGIQECRDEDATPHSDTVNFQPGLKWVYAAKEWERVK